MSPFALRKHLLREAAAILELPHAVRERLLRIYRRQDRELYNMLRSCLAEVQQEENYRARRAPRPTGEAP